MVTIKTDYLNDYTLICNNRNKLLIHLEMSNTYGNFNHQIKET